MAYKYMISVFLILLCSAMPCIATPPESQSLSLFRFIEEREGATPPLTTLEMRDAVLSGIHTNKFHKILPLLSSQYSINTHLAVVDTLEFLRHANKKTNLPFDMVHKLHKIALSNTNIILRATAINALYTWEAAEQPNSKSIAFYLQQLLQPIWRNWQLLSKPTQIQNTLSNEDISFLIFLWKLAESWSDSGKLSIAEAYKKISQNPEINIKINDKTVYIKDNTLDINITLNLYYIEELLYLESEKSNSSDKDKKRILESTLFYLFHWKRLYQDLVFSPDLTTKIKAIEVLLYTPTDLIIQEVLVQQLSNPKVFQKLLYSQYQKESLKQPKTLDPKAEQALRQFTTRPLPKYNINSTTDLGTKITYPVMKWSNRLPDGWTQKNILHPQTQQTSVIEATEQLNRQTIFSFDKPDTQEKLAVFLSPTYPMSVRMRVMKIFLQNHQQLLPETHHYILQSLLTDPSNLIKIYPLMTFWLWENKPPFCKSICIYHAKRTSHALQCKMVYGCH